MHELSLCENIRSILDAQATAHGAQKITRVRLEIGRFSSVEKRALAFAFDIVMKGSPAEGAALEMIDLPGRARCLDCLGEVEIDDRLATCPACGGGRLLPTGGDEMRVKDMEVA